MLPRNLRNRSRLDLDRDPAAVCRHKLKAGVSLKQPVESFMDQLTQFSQVRGEILQRRERKMVDVPSSQWDRELLGGIFLPREGRTTTEEYMARPHAVFEVDRNDGCRYFVMRRSLPSSMDCPDCSQDTEDCGDNIAWIWSDCDCSRPRRECLESWSGSCSPQECQCGECQEVQ